MMLCCLVALVAVASATPAASVDYAGGLTLETLQQLTDILQDRVQEIAAALADTSTRSSVISARLLQMTDFDLPALRLQNTQQDSILDSYQNQAKDLQDRVDVATAAGKEAHGLAGDAENGLARQIDSYLNGSKVRGVNEVQSGAITTLAAQVADVKAAYVNSLATTIANLNGQQDGADSRLSQLSDFIASRKCEYGAGDFDPQTNSSVRFSTVFANAPEVIVTLNGFKANREFYGKQHNKYNSLSMNKFASDVTTSGFTVQALDISEGMVELEAIYCSWMACQNLDVNFNWAQ